MWTGIITRHLYAFCVMFHTYCPNTHTKVPNVHFIKYDTFLVYLGLRSAVEWVRMNSNIQQIAILIGSLSLNLINLSCETIYGLKADSLKTNIVFLNLYQPSARSTYILCFYDIACLFSTGHLSFCYWFVNTLYILWILILLWYRMHL